MAFATIKLQGGPCDGRYVPVTQALLQRGYLSCQGVTYQIEGQSPGVYVGVPQSTGTGGTLQSLAPDVFAGWDHLRRALSKDLWPALNTARRNNRAALRVLTTRHRVRGK